MMKSSRFLTGIILIAATLGCHGQSAKTGNTPSTTTQTKVSTENKPVVITKEEFAKLVMDYKNNPDTWKYAGKQPCLVDFYADWCGPCRIAGPILEDLSKEYAGKVTFYKVNIDQEQELASLFNVQSIPAFLFCPMTGNPTISAGIANTPEATKQMFREQIDKLLLNKGGSQSSL
jgi:thioredoxin